MHLFVKNKLIYAKFSTSIKFVESFYIIIRICIDLMQVKCGLKYVLINYVSVYVRIINRLNLEWVFTRSQIIIMFDTMSRNYWDNESLKIN